MSQAHDNVSPSTAGHGSAGGVTGLRSTPSLPSRPALEESDYPDVPFWHFHEFTAHEKLTKGESTTNGPKLRGSTRASQGINVSMLYVADAQGNVIDGFRATEIRALAIKLFLRMGVHAPPTWTQGSIDLQRMFSADICAQYPEMGLCANDWKVQHMAKKMYPSWYSSHSDTGGIIIKSEGGDVNFLQSQKRKHRTQPTSSLSTHKRVKAEDSSSSVRLLILH